MFESHYGREIRMSVGQAGFFGSFYKESLSWLVAGRKNKWKRSLKQIFLFSDFLENDIFRMIKMKHIIF
jgi:hypothetical protein